jgi:hypothetical protein
MQARQYVITVNLTENEALILLGVVRRFTERWPAELTLKAAERKLDDALLAHEEGARA